MKIITNPYVACVGRDLTAAEKPPEGPGELLFADGQSRIFYDAKGAQRLYYYGSSLGWYEPIFWTLAEGDETLEIAQLLADLLYERTR